MTTTTAPDPIVVGLNLDGHLAVALDQACGETLSSRAGFLRRILVETLRESGHLPPLPTGPRTVARIRPGATKGQRR